MGNSEILFIGTHCAGCMKNDLDRSITVKDAMYLISSKQRRLFMDCEHVGSVFPGRLYIECDMADCSRDVGFYVDAVRFKATAHDHAYIQFYVMAAQDHIYRLDYFGSLVIKDDVKVVSIPYSIAKHMVGSDTQTLYPLEA